MDHQQSPCEIGLVQAFGMSASRGPAYLRDFAQATEALGFHSLWMPEHVVFFEQYQSVYPYPPHPGSSERPTLPVGKRAGLFDPLLACQAAAMHTTTLRVGTAVALLPLRHPLLWAREVATLDHFSGGRFEFGIGIGWLAEEFAALNVDFSTRGRLTDEYLAALHAAWSQEESTFHGEFVNFTDALSFPKPVQPRPARNQRAPGGPASIEAQRRSTAPVLRPPILIGGESTAALRRVARYGDGWYGWNITPVQLDAALTQLDMQLAQHQFIDGRIRTRADVFVQVGLRHPGPLDAIAELVQSYRDLGAERVVVSVDIATRSFEQQLQHIADSLGV